MSTDAPAPERVPALGIARLLLLGAAVGWVVGMAAHFGVTSSLGFWREALSLGAAVLAVVGFTRLGDRGRRSQAVAALLVLMTIGALGAQAGFRFAQVGRPAQLANWGIYHYYLGSKYFDELGYTELYRETLKADHAGPDKFDHVKRIRNLSTYDPERSAAHRVAPRNPRWTDARWAEFTADVHYIGGLRAKKDWVKILNDRGYNPPPSYTLVAGLFTGTLSVRSAVQQTLLASLDLLVLLAALLLSVRAYGLKRTLLVALAYCLWFGNSRRIYGQFWINDWFAACWAAAAAWKLDRHRLAGGLVAYAAAVRVFPGVMFAGPVLAVLPGILRTRTVPRPVVRFLGMGALVGVLLVGASAARYGTDAWSDWTTNIVEHSANHEGGMRRVGLKHLAALDWQGGLRVPAHKVSVRANLDANAGLHKASAAVLLVLLLIAMARSDAHEAMLIALGIVFIGTVASRYYGAVFVLWLLMMAPRARAPDRIDRLLGDGEAPRPTRWVVLDVLFFLALWAMYAAPISGKFPRVEYFWVNVLMAGWMVAMIALTAFGEKGVVGEGG